MLLFVVLIVAVLGSARGAWSDGHRGTSRHADHSLYRARAVAFAAPQRACMS